MCAQLAAIMSILIFKECSFQQTAVKQARSHFKMPRTPDGKWRYTTSKIAVQGPVSTLLKLAQMTFLGVKLTVYYAPNLGTSQ